jgi:hypothetical protein
MKTILLLNHSPAAIKLYEVFDGLDKALEALCAIYEEHLLMPFHDIRMYPARISYRYGDLMRCVRIRVARGQCYDFENILGIKMVENCDFDSKF